MYVNDLHEVINLGKICTSGGGPPPGSVFHDGPQKAGRQKEVVWKGS
jgi:hypothetical protein